MSDAVESLGTCRADGCPGEVIVERVAGEVAEAVCNLCGTEFAAPVTRERIPEPEPDFLDERGPWWKRD